MSVMAMAAEVALDDDDNRAAERHETALAGGVRRSGATRIPGIVRDLSCTGFRIEAQERLPKGSVVWLKIGHLEPLMAEVVWTDRLSAGCRFAAPLHQSVLDVILRSGR